MKKKKKNLRSDDLLLITTRHFILQFTFCYFIKDTESSMFSGFHPWYFIIQTLKTNFLIR
jgi:hypothetical protein